MAGINLVPVRPLDGGRVLELVLVQRTTAGTAARVLGGLGLAAALGLAVMALRLGGEYALPLGLLAAVLAYAALAPTPSTTATTD